MAYLQRDQRPVSTAPPAHPRLAYDGAAAGALGYGAGAHRLRDLLEMLLRMGADLNHRPRAEHAGGLLPVFAEDLRKERSEAGTVGQGYCVILGRERRRFLGGVERGECVDVEE